MLERTDQGARSAGSAGANDPRPILLVPYMWIGDFVRCHTVVRLLKARWPDRPVDVLTAPLTGPLADYMPGVRKAIVADLPRRRLALARQHELARRLASEGYGSALVMPRTWKSALAPFLAHIPERTGFVGEARFLLLNDARWGERKLERMADRCAALAQPKTATLPAQLPPPQLVIPPAEVRAWKARHGLDAARTAVALAPGAVGSSKRWPAEGYAAVAAELARQEMAVWVLGGPGEKELAQQIVTQSGGAARDLSGGDLRHAALAIAAADAVLSNDSGLMHVAAAAGTPTLGIFGPTSPWHWAPLNGLAATIETATTVSCRPCHKPVCAFGHHRCMREISHGEVMTALTRALGERALLPAE
jgi:heptosyltransferase-2